MPAASGSFGAAALNRALDRAPWARERLAPFAGRRFVVSVGPLSAAFRIVDQGTLEAAPVGGMPGPDLELVVSPLSLPSLLADPRRWNELVTETGDPDLGGALKDLAQTVPWLVEDGCARVFGAMAGQRIADAGRTLLAFPGHAASRLADSAASYARDEAEVLARGDDMRPFNQQLTELATRTDALGARVDALASRLAAPDATSPGRPA